MRLLMPFTIILLFIINGDISASENVIFQLDSAIYGKHIGYYTAKQRGMYRAAGMRVSIQRGFYNSWKSVGGGDRSDYGIAGIDSTILARSNGYPIKLVSIWHKRAMHSILALKSSGIRNPWNLEGKRLGITVGDYSRQYWPFFKKIIGLRSVGWTQILPNSSNHYLLAKKVNAILTTATATIPMKFQAAMVGEEVVELLLDDYGLRLPTDGIITSIRKTVERPDQVKAFISTSLRGNAWAIENPKKAVNIFLKNHPDQHPKLTRQWWELSSKFQIGSQRSRGLGHMDLESMQYAHNITVRAFGIVNPPALSDWYTTKFLPRNLPKPKLPKK